ncbi:reverse transcriptase family protein [Ramlibacter tataouinensis]|uniref:reverse transcriptase family protein n=1 Tax=Ramlibacter tataouinensis TaxID=94132 RepID=UPI0022F404CF|nr:reverse transcriptase family protein [Ramlibacter tataouinensis]WBY01524.1 reverse transcriptase family protein [Ramlibacter tataouinensis]
MQDLKIVQKRINRAIFEKVTYPSYLYGGIAERDYVRNARVHANAKSLIALDVQDFYDSIPADEVFSIFKFFCRFPDPVARALTDLTTRHGRVPQGACTSSHIANLVFFDTEHRIVRELQQQGLRYSRLLDDITISAEKPLTRERTSKVVHKIKLLLANKHLKLKGNKTRVCSNSNPEVPMEVTGLWLNRGAPRVFRSERHDIRAEVFRLERMYELSSSAPDYHEEHNRVSGRISKIAYVGHFEAERYRAKIRSILPIYDGKEVVRTMRLARVVCATPIHLRGSLSYLEKWHQVNYRLGLLARTNKGLAAKYRALLQKCLPPVSKEELLYG